MPEVVKSTARQRHESIFQQYIDIMTELGEEARNVTKKSLYDKVAKRTGYSQGYISHIITMRFREGNGHRTSN